ncbi:hypothetical protein T4D_4684 [Trichinella pseudospiralis]|uniref:Uncharacterized protein n=1 Tax=Trichinella pseudospiralis TaxID=6337 RepID=A0A0V1FGP7_TRIPS|nr:hypothetical protein T4D_4684 [Trichinella pseudospiralis]
MIYYLIMFFVVEGYVKICFFFTSSRAKVIIATFNISLGGIPHQFGAGFYVLLHGLMREPTMHLTVHVRFFEMPIESRGFERMREIH